MQKLIAAVPVLLLCACSRSGQREKFMAPVEKIFKLDSTRIGVSTILSGLRVPWEIAWGPDDQIWFTEQDGTVSKVDPHTGKKKTLLTIPGVYRKRTSGLLGMAIYDSRRDHYLFLDYTYKTKDSLVVSRLVRYTFTADTLQDPRILLEVPGGTGHIGSRVAVSPDGKVFWSTGDGQLSKNAQDVSSPDGKILRLNMDGTIPKDNPFPGNPFWSRGHRNIEGLVCTADGLLFASEHGEATDDEINRIQKGKNYGWPNVEGYYDRPDEKAYADSTPVTEPLKAWTPTIAPAGIDYYNSEKIPEWKNTILLATLKATSLRALRLNSEKNAIISEKIYFPKEFGRLRDICISPDGDVYISTSNRDWNLLGVPQPHDDRIIRIAKISDLDNLSQVNVNRYISLDSAAAVVQESSSAGQAIYNSYCASCHKEDGRGSKGGFPALRENPVVTGEKKLLVQVLLKGEAGIPAGSRIKFDEQMPAFSFMDDRQIADVLSYARNSWGNRADSISAREVNTIRKKIK